MVRGARDQGDGKGLVVVSRFNETVTKQLLSGALAALKAEGWGEQRVDTLWVPGAFELPVAVTAGFNTGRYAFAVALGAVIRGETPHFEYVSQAAMVGLVGASTQFARPVGFGVLTCDTEEQALARAGGPKGNKGEDAARAALDMLRTLSELDEGA